MTNDSYPVLCPGCRSEVDAPESGNTYQCKHCGQAFVVDNPDMPTSASKEESAAAAQQAKAPQVQTVMTVNKVVNESPNSGQARISVLDSWKTSVGFSILGFVLIGVWAAVFGWIIAIGISPALPRMPYQSTTGITGVINGLIYSAICILYALIFYPSYFTEKPLIKSSRVISCLNFLFGNVIFGAFWNHNLTLKKKGVSYCVFAILNFLSICCSALLIFLVVGQYTDINEQHAPTSSNVAASEPSYISKDGQKAPYINEEAGFAVAFPSEPIYDSDDVEVYGLECTNEYWIDQVSNSEVYLVQRLVLPSDSPILDNESAINGGMSAVLLSFCKSFDVPTEEADIRYDEFLGYPSAYTSFVFSGSSFIGRAFAGDDSIYCIVAAAKAQSQAEAFISSFAFL